MRLYKWAHASVNHIHVNICKVRTTASIDYCRHSCCSVERSGRYEWDVGVRLWQQIVLGILTHARQYLAGVVKESFSNRNGIGDPTCDLCESFPCQDSLKPINSGSLRTPALMSQSATRMRKCTHQGDVKTACLCGNLTRIWLSSSNEGIFISVRSDSCGSWAQSRWRASPCPASDHTDCGRSSRTHTN